MKRLYISFIVLLGCFFSFAAQRIQPEVSARLDSAKLLMGELLGLRVDITAQSDTSRIDFPLISQLKGRRYIGIANDSVEITNKYRIDTLRDQGKTVFSYKFHIQAFDSGRYEIPPLQIKVDGISLETEPLSLEVLPVKVKVDDKIDSFSDLAEPFELIPEGMLQEEKSNNGWILWLILGCLILLALLAYLFFRYRTTGHILPTRKPLPPYQQALKQLDKLQGQKLWEKGKTKEYYTRLTDILRRYIRNQFNIKTLERTSAEIISDIEKDSELDVFSSSLKEIFSTADIVKFAKVTTTAEENQKLIESAREFVIESRPIDTEDTPKEKGGEK